MQAEEQRASWSRIAAPARILYVRDLQRLAEPPWNHLRFAPDQTGRGVWVAGVVGITGLVLAYFTHASNIPFQRGNPPSHWKDWDVGRLASGVIVPVSGGFWTLSELPAGGFSHWLEESGLWMACKRDDCASGWRFWDVGRLAGGQMFHWLEESTVEGKKKPRWRENHRGEKGEKKKKGFNCRELRVGSWSALLLTSPI